MDVAAETLVQDTPASLDEGQEHAGEPGAGGDGKTADNKFQTAIAAWRSVSGNLYVCEQR
jgi:hypothetical protein